MELKTGKVQTWNGQKKEKIRYKFPWKRNQAKTKNKRVQNTLNMTGIFFYIRNMNVSKNKTGTSKCWKEKYSSI